MVRRRREKVKERKEDENKRKKRQGREMNRTSEPDLGWMINNCELELGPIKDQVNK